LGNVGDAMSKSASAGKSLPPRSGARGGAGFPITPLARDFPGGYRVPQHRHEHAQLIFASSGVMRIITPDGIWVAPPMRAVWVPAAVDHEILVSRAVQLRTLLIDPEVRASLPRQCCVIEVSPLLRELIIRVSELGPALAHNAHAEHFLALIFDEIKASETVPLHVPMPSDPRLIRICRGILNHPSDKRSCGQWGRTVGASGRTLERRFQLQTGISFGAWRRQVRLLAALDQLAINTPVANIALDLGYRSASAFTVMFKRALGQRPTHFFSQARAPLPTVEEVRAARQNAHALGMLA